MRQTVTDSALLTNLHPGQGFWSSEGCLNGLRFSDDMDAHLCHTWLCCGCEFHGRVTASTYLSRKCFIAFCGCKATGNDEPCEKRPTRESALGICTLTKGRQHIRLQNKAKIWGIEC